MHWIYLIYTFVCTSQLAIFLLIISLGLHVKSIDLVKLDQPISYPFTINPVIANNNNNTNPHDYFVFNNESGGGGTKKVEVLVSKYVVLDMEIFICSILSVLFSIFYMYISKLEHQRPFLLENKDDESLLDFFEPLAVRPLERVRIVFWVFSLMQYFIIFAAINFYTTAVEKYLYVIIKAVTVWLLCRTGKQKQTKEILFILLLFYIYLLWIFSAWFSHENKTRESLIVLLIETALDSLLILCHYWDPSAPMLTILNCRLFYVATTCTLVQCLVFF